MERDIRLSDHRNVRVPGVYPECETCPSASIHGKAVAEQLEADGVGNVVEVVCEPSMAGHVEMSIKPVGRLTINSQQTEEFGRVEFRGTVDCPGFQAQSAATPPQG
ncbi:MAG: hypothetical protein WBO77_00340 [Microgenomates group bacterium]